MTKDYIEDESGAKFPLNCTFDGVNNFVFSTDVMFEDLQALCLGLASKLEAAEQNMHWTAGIVRRFKQFSVVKFILSLWHSLASRQ